jgi:hypothetical protein
VSEIKTGYCPKKYRADTKGMARGRKSDRYSLKYREDRETWEFSLHLESGLPGDLWQRRSFSTIPHEVRARFPNVRTRTAAERVVEALIEYLRGHEEAAPVVRRGQPVGDWMRLFFDETTSPRAKKLVGKNRAYSPKTIRSYASIFKTLACALNSGHTELCTLEGPRQFEVTDSFIKN